MLNIILGIVSLFISFAFYFMFGIMYNCRPHEGLFHPGERDSLIFCIIYWVFFMLSLYFFGILNLLTKLL
jgi:hypothetical protein